MQSSVLDNTSIKAEVWRELAETNDDPWKFVVAAFPWGKGELEGKQPEDWQEELLKGVRDKLITYTEAIQYARASGHGIGKSALVAWLILWAMTTREDTRGIVTANTQLQLTTKTWPELAKWHNLFVCRDLFEVTATAIFRKDKDREKTWRIDAVPWSRNKEIQTEAFAGLHNHGKRILIIFDEASAIADKIYEVMEGALTDKETEIMWFIFGNPTRNVGRFHAAFHKLRHRWDHKQIDSRSVTISNKDQLNKWIEDYGIDSDFVKIRVLGQFPMASDRQFISNALVEPARGKHLTLDKYNFAPTIIACDPAWTGGDEIVIVKRQGLASTLLAKFPKNDDDGLIAGYLARMEDDHKADAVFIDIGYGTGIYSFGKQMKRKWTLVSFAAKPTSEGYLNKRAEMWGDMKQWLKDGGALPDDEQLCVELTWPEGVPRLDGKIVLESKEDMRKRGLGSPNRADALALTFAYPVAKRSESIIMRDRKEFAHSQYDPLATA